MAVGMDASEISLAYMAILAHVPIASKVLERFETVFRDAGSYHILLKSEPTSPV